MKDEMNPELRKLINAKRRKKRDLDELYKIRLQNAVLKSPDVKLMKMLEEEIHRLEKS